MLKSINIDELPELLQFLNTNKPVKKITKAPSTPVTTGKPSSSPAKNDKKDKQVQLKKIFEDIVGKTFKEMVESNEYDNAEIEDETRRKFNQEFQKLKLDLKSPLLDKVVLPKADKDNDTDFWSTFFKDENEDKIGKLNKACASIDAILKNQGQSVAFVVPMWSSIDLTK